ALAAGDLEAAQVSWQRAIELGADRAPLEERLAVLTGTTDTFAETWTKPLSEIRERLAVATADGQLEDAPVVIAHQTAAFRVTRSGLAERLHQVVFAVRQPEQASGVRGYSITFSPSLRHARVLEARLVRRDGSVIQASRRDRSLLPDLEIRMWYDTRVIELGFPRLEQGDLIEVRYLLTDRGPTNPVADGYFGELLMLGSRAPVLDSRVIVEAPVELPVRMVFDNFPDEPSSQTSTHDGLQRTIAEISALRSYPLAAHAPPASERVPYAVLSTVESWEELARMYARLIRDQIRSTPDLVEIVREVTHRKRKRSEIIDALYGWVIENTRYVALEFGIHAIKPYDVADVLHRRHGDCKDKSSLLVAMLAEAGIEAHVALVRTHDQGLVDTRVPSFSLFDHAIVYVPGEERWFDGTVLHHGPSELPMQDRDALALVVFDEKRGGLLVRTPAASPADAEDSREERIALQPSGAASVSVRVEARGEEAAAGRYYYRLADQRRARLEHLLRARWPDASVDEADFAQVGLYEPVVRFRFEAEVPRFAHGERRRLFVPLGLALPLPPVERPVAGRELALWLPPPSRKQVRSSIELPESCRITELAEPVRVTSAWGELVLELAMTPREVRVDIVATYRSGRVEPQQTDSLGQFITEVRQALEQKVVVECGP
ncbi:MAG: DUF3857 domain-containing protein, partial [Acidobacteriota bacterium]